MHLLSVQEYITRRESYNYNSCDCNFKVIQTGSLSYFGDFEGIFVKIVPLRYKEGINLRKFEVISHEVFHDCLNASKGNNFSRDYLSNLREVSKAIVYWKMSSQGGRAKIKVENLLNKWKNDTVERLLLAFQQKMLSKFEIGGVRSPTASAFLRFLFPSDFGIIDSRVVGNYTQPNGITTLSLRKDGYINDTRSNAEKYYFEYIPFLSCEAKWLNDQKMTFKDYDENGIIFKSAFKSLRR